MLKDNKIVFENLNDEQERTLIALLNLIIPPSEDGKMPGAADVGFSAYMHKQSLLQWIRDGLRSIVEESQNQYSQEFSALSSSEQTQLIDRLRRRHFRFFGRLITEVIQCYYQHDQILEAIGLEARAPFPEGYFVDEGDLTLLEPVYERGKLYRD